MMIGTDDSRLSVRATSSAVHAWQPEIEYDEVRPPRTGQRQCINAGLSRENGVAGMLQIVTRDVRDFLLVIHDQNRRQMAPPSLAPVPQVPRPPPRPAPSPAAAKEQEEQQDEEQWAEPNPHGRCQPYG